MREHDFDALTRDAAGGISRRGSLLTLGAAALIAVTSGAPPAAAKKNRKKRKNKNNDDDKKCRQQVEECEEIFTLLCRGNDRCLAPLRTCCELFSDCEAEEALDCIFLSFGDEPERDAPA